MQYTYDSIGNLLTKTSSLGPASPEHLGLLKYTSKRPHAPAEAGGASQTYDAAGFVTNSNSTQLAWNARGQLESAYDRAGATVGVYSYDADGQRVKKIERNSVTYYITPDYEVRDGIATLYIRLRNERVIKLECGSTAPPHLDSDKNGIITAHDAYLANQAGDSQRAKQILQASARRLLLEQDQPITITYVHSDNLGSVTATSDADGVITDRAEYYPYGTLRQSQSNVPPIDAYGWTGQETDQATNLSYHAARYYNGTYWQSPDPLFETLNEACTKRPLECANRYAYALNNPINFTDPTGQATVGEAIQQKIVLNLQNGNSTRATTWAVAGGFWDTLGSESISKLTDNAITNRNDMTKADVGFAALEMSGMAGGARLSARLAADAAKARVFWSGSPEAMALARDFAQTSGKTTLEMTLPGQLLNAVTTENNYKFVRPLWVAASRSFAEGARSTADVFTSAAGVKPASIWNRVELPVLMKNDIQITKHTAP